MQIENLGHESWLISTRKGSILIDPLLRREFGRSSQYRYQKLSHANVPAGTLGAVSGVILTCDHFQHFDRSSFSLLSSEVEVFIPQTFSESEAQWLRDRGAFVKRVPIGTPVDIGNLQFLFVPSGSETPPWDARVCSLMVAECDCPEPKWIFIQSDTGINRSISNMIPPSWFRKPDLVVVTCHYREYAESGYSSWDNFICPPPSLDDPRAAFDLVSAVLPLDISPLNVASLYVVAGGDYERQDRPLPSAKRDNARLAQLMNDLAVNCTINAATAGATYFVGDALEARRSKPVSIARADNAPTPFSVSELKNYSPLASDPAISRGLAHFAKALLLSELGHTLLFTDEYLGVKLDTKRFVLKIVGTANTTTYEFCFSKGAFVICDKPDDELLQKPAGLVLSASAFRDIVMGFASAPETCSNNSLQWHIGPLSHSPLGLLYHAFSHPIFKPMG
ncbi:MBL fold metallo-hydrolase [Cupriavidus basilensis]|uniref:MBL fold metallo-hydrolase n=1 Tax=Cupriavidus basilensis TaxID=68895 RepID=UPI0023E81B13|nr:hypothetical protein [Cupriavidus basilensis]MDF3881433.1 hypothetical protein [Cupriavidus basilensis]